MHHWVQNAKNTRNPAINVQTYFHTSHQGSDIWQKNKSENNDSLNQIWFEMILKSIKGALCEGK